MRPMYIPGSTLIFSVPACFLLCGCTAGQKTADFAPKLDGAYTAEAELEYGGGQTAAMSVTRYGKAQWEAAFTAPASLEGVVLQFDGNAVTASYKGLQFSVPKSALPAKNMLVLATDALDLAAETVPLPCTEQSDGTWRYAGESEAGGCTVTFSADGEPRSVEMPAQPFTLRFSSYTVIAPEVTGTAETSASAEAASAPETTVTA